MQRGSKIEMKDGTVTKTVTCEVTGELVSVSVPVECYDAWRRGALIQRAMPMLTADEREIFITGTTNAEWDEMFKDDETALQEDADAT